jgi:hypothetical protein
MTQTASRIATRCQSEPTSVTRSEANEEPLSTNEVALAKLIAFFKVLDKWDYEVTNGKIV